MHACIRPVHAFHCFIIFYVFIDVNIYICQICLSDKPQQEDGFVCGCVSACMPVRKHLCVNTHVCVCACVSCVVISESRSHMLFGFICLF